MRKLIFLFLLGTMLFTTGCGAAAGGTEQPAGQATQPAPVVGPAQVEPAQVEPAQVEPAPTPTAAAAAPKSERRCGDGVCDGPENAGSCPADCGGGQTAATQAPEPTPMVSSEEAAPTGAPLPALVVCEQALCEFARISLLDLQGRAIQNNVLKLFSAAADAQRNLVYVAGIMTADIAILDGRTEEWVGTVESGMGGSNALKYLHIDATANYLYIIDATNNLLRRVDLNTGEPAEPVQIRAGMGQAAVDTLRGRIYLASREAPHFTAYDGKTLQVIYTNNDLPEGAGWPVYDAQNDAVFVLDIAATSAERSIYRINPENGAIVETIRYSAPEKQRSGEFNYDPASGRFFLVAGQRLLVLGRDGSRQLEIPLALKQYALESMIFDSLHDRLVVLVTARPQNGEVAGVGGHLMVYDASSGELVSELAYGNKPHRLTLNPANGRIYTPNGDASILWSVDSGSYAEARALRLGDSVEQVVLANGGSTLYMNSRLGGSYIAQFSPETGAFSTFNSGMWPIPMKTDASGEHLMVLNAWDSTLSVFAAGAETALLRTIPLGLPRGTTDRLPEIAIDSRHGLAYVAYPEFGKVAVADWQNGAVVTTIDIQGYPAGEEGGGPGEMQVAIDEDTRRLFVLWNTRQAKLQTYAGDENYGLVGEFDLASLGWDKLRQLVNSEGLFIDAELGRLFVGPYEFDLSSGQPTGRSLAQGQRIFAIDPQTNSYWASGVEEGRNFVAAVDRDSLAVNVIEMFDAAATTKPSYAFDAVRRRLYAGYMTAAEVRVYAVGSWVNK